MGAGGSKQESISETINSNISSIVAKSIQTCDMKVQMVQDIKIKGENITIDDLTVRQGYRGTLICNQTQSQVAALQDTITSSLMQTSGQSNQAILGAINGLAGTKDTQLNRSSVQNLVQNSINMELMNKITTDINMKQLIEIGESDVTKNVNIGQMKPVLFEQSADVIMEAASKQIQKTELITAIKSQETKVTQQESRNPISDTISAVGGAVNNMLSGASKLFGVGSIYIIAFFIFIVAIAYIFKDSIAQVIGGLFGGSVSGVKSSGIVKLPPAVVPSKPAVVPSKPATSPSKVTP
jgi:hypothetical protein